MALNNYSTNLLSISVNGRLITDFGEADPPYTTDPIDPKSVLRRGLGGNSMRLDRITPGRRVTLNLNPGGPDSAYMQTLFTTGTTVTFQGTQIGTLEATVGTEGVIVNDGQVGRGGQTITDDQYIIEFPIWTETKGGN